MNSEDNPFEPVSFSITEILTNPFEPSDLGEATFGLELGEGGYNSGKKLTKYKSVLKGAERTKILNTNAQRVYRNRNREAYNENMKALWQVNKDDNNSSYKKWKANQAIANQNYRLNRQISNPSESSIMTELRILYKEIKPSKGRPKKGALSKEERKEQFFKSQANIDKARELAIAKYKAKKAKFLEDPSIKFKENGKPRNLSDGTPYKGFGNKKNIPKSDYAKSNYNNLELGKDAFRQSNNKKDLETYYKNVLTTTNKTIPQDAKLLEKPLAVLKKLRETHYNNLSAGEWGLNGDFKRKDGEKGKRQDGRHSYTGKDTF